MASMAACKPAQPSCTSFLPAVVRLQAVLRLKTQSAQNYVAPYMFAKLKFRDKKEKAKLAV
jgi:hypothetical protein